jgi:hypothetical protein
MGDFGEDPPEDTAEARTQLAVFPKGEGSCLLSVTAAEA